MAPRLSLGELFVEVSKTIKHADKIELLHQYSALPLWYLLKLAYNDVKWDIPEGKPPIKEWKGRPGSASSELSRECRRMYMFIEQCEPGLKRIRREKLFQDMLEGLEPPEPDVLVAIKDKTFEKTYHLPRKVVEAAFPGLLDLNFVPRFIR